MKKLFSILLVIPFMLSCESHRVKENRKTYRDFLMNEMSDAPEYFKIHNEIVNNDNEASIYYLVDFETVYISKRYRKEVRIEFIGDYMHKIGGVSPKTYKAYYLLDIIQ